MCFVGSLSVNKLKALVQKLSGVKMHDQVLLLSGQSGLQEDISHHGTKELSFFDIQESDWYLTVEKSSDTLQRRRERASNRSAQEEEHEAALQRLKKEEERLMGVQRAV